MFRITPSGTLTTLYTFCSQPNCTDGSSPEAGLIQATNGDMYGTTTFGGSNPYLACGGSSPRGCGTVFKISPSGTLTTLYNFCSQSDCADGTTPSGLIRAINGDLYGTTANGGSHASPIWADGSGTVFKITPSGTLTTLYTFCSQAPSCPDGAVPLAGLVQATDGDLYGTTGSGGASGWGTIFRITPEGTLTTVYSFCSQTNCTDGLNPGAVLVQATDGDFYGTTASSGEQTGGTVFKFTSSGTLTTLYTFCSQPPSCGNGYDPFAGLAQATNGNFYGTTSAGGTSNNSCFNGGGIPPSCGTLFTITPGGTLTSLYDFCCSDGIYPSGVMMQATNGNLYGTTFADGAHGGGTIFSLSVGLGPFVETQTTAGRVGAVVRILGTDLRGATSVTFNGTTATFTVVSKSDIKATVPSSATTGPVKVVTPRGTLESNFAFTVKR